MYQNILLAYDGSADGREASTAREMNADLIVVGHRDQGTLARWLNGSVGASILHHPPCSVLIAVKSEQIKKTLPQFDKTQTRGEG